MSSGVRTRKSYCVCSHKKKEHGHHDGPCNVVPCECAGFLSEWEEEQDYQRHEARVSDRVLRMEKIAIDVLEGSVSDEDVRWLLTEYAALAVVGAFLTKADKEHLIALGKKLAAVRSPT